MGRLAKGKSGELGRSEAKVLGTNLQVQLICGCWWILHSGAE